MSKLRIPPLVFLLSLLFLFHLPVKGQGSLEPGRRTDEGEDFIDASSGSISIETVGGGDVQVNYFLSHCVGYARSRSTYRVIWSGTSESTSLVISFIADVSDTDTTLIVHTPDDNWLCNDDALDLNPQIIIEQPLEGSYDIWVGSYSRDELIPGILTVDITCLGCPVISDGPVIDNCTLTPFHTDGQGRYKIVGASGGEAASVPVALQALDWWSVTEYGYPSYPQVNIVIVDDYSPPPDGGTPHGQVVESLIRELMVQIGDENMRLVPIDVSAFAYRSSQVADELNRVTSSDDYIIPNAPIIVNMSIALIPCSDGSSGFEFGSFLEAYQAEEGDLLTYLGGDVAAFQDLLYNKRTNHDPLRSNIRTLMENAARNDTQAIIVASAGNYGPNGPFAPARWPEVISVSAYDNVGIGEPFIANYGEVITYGGWFPIVVPSGATEYYIGTSFAAPYITLFLAQRIGVGLPCDMALRPSLGPIASLSLEDWGRQLGCL